MKNTDLINMARLGHSSIPVDLMTYEQADKQPSVFLLKEDKRQSILTVFNWTEEERTRSVDFKALGLKELRAYQITEVFDDKPCCDASSEKMNLVEPPHSVRMYKLIDKAVAPAALAFEVHAAPSAKAGETIDFGAEGTSADEPVLTYHWDFGDGVTLDGMKVKHTYTKSGTYSVRVTAMGIDAVANSKTVAVSVSGTIPTRFVPANKKRPSEQ